MEVAIITIAGTLILIGVVTYFFKSKIKNESWEGNLVKKFEKVDSSGDYDQTYYYLEIQLPDGSHKNILVSKKVYQQFNAGDRLVKARGDSHPKILHAS